MVSLVEWWTDTVIARWRSWCVDTLAAMLTLWVVAGVIYGSVFVFDNKPCCNITLTQRQKTIPLSALIQVWNARLHTDSHPTLQITESPWKATFYTFVKNVQRDKTSQRWKAIWVIALVQTVHTHNACVHTHTHTHAYAYTHTHTHTHTLSHTVQQMMYFPNRGSVCSDKEAKIANTFMECPDWTM